MTVKEAADRLQIPVTALRWCMQEDARHKNERGYRPYCPYGMAIKRKKVYWYIIIPEKLEAFLRDGNEMKVPE